MKSPLISFLLIATVLLIAVPAGAAEIPHIRFEDPEERWWDVLNDVRDADLENSKQTRGHLGKGLDVTIPAGQFRGLGPFLSANANPDKAWYRYYMKVDYWPASWSGKLPGPAGLYGSSGRGCIPSTPGNPGWSARGVYEPPGQFGAKGRQIRIGTYLYHLDQEGDCGDILLWEPGLINYGRWYCIQGAVDMNALDRADGSVRAWVDGKQAFAQNNLRLRRFNEREVGARHFWLNIYHGGKVTAPKDLNMDIDEVVFSTSGKVGCADPFTDDNNSPHEDDIKEMHARQYLYGCGHRLVCPGQKLTRAQMAAMLSRVLHLPSTATNHFIDDQGHWAEGAINRFAEAGVTIGCDPPANTRFCPEKSVSRGEMAVFIQRAFQIAQSQEDRFADDTGHY
ncbi:MAG: hypothetical protein GEU79_11400, partial [Acidimicrobiia bacterium]|nr:hypothetical protein [Acidimicrobiia bacterium]